MKEQKTTLGCNNLVLFVMLVFLFHIPQIFYSQNSTDTLTLARKFLKKGELSHAFRLMKSYSKHHPDDFNASWLYAKTSYLAGRINISGKQYEKTVRLSPDNLYAQFDYADFLVNTGRYEKAQNYLTSYLGYDKDNLICIPMADNMKVKYYFRLSITEDSIQFILV